MATSLTCSLQLTLGWLFQNILDNGNVKDQIGYTIQDSLADGDALDSAQVVWHDRRTLSATSEDLDLSGSLTGSFGVSVAFTKIKGFLVYNRATTAGYTLALGGAASNQFINWVANSSDIVNVGPGGCFFLWNPSLAGYAVTAGTGDLLKINSGANAITFDIVLIGTGTG